MRVPIQNPSAGMGAMPGAHAGARADADAFGSGGWRDLRNLARAGQDAGNSVLAEARRRRRDEDEAFVRDRINQAQLGLLEESQRIFAKTGGDADSAPEEMERYLEGARQSHGKALKNGNQRKLFDDAWARMAQGGAAEAAAHRRRQMEVYGRQTLEAQNAAVTRKANALAAPGQGVNPADLAVIVHNTDLLTRGQPPEARELARTGAKAAYFMSQADALAAAAGPGEALRYLGDRRVGETFTPGEMRALRGKYGNDMISAADRELGDRLGEEYDEEDDLYDVVDEAMPDADDKRRETVRKRAASRIKSKRSAKAGERRELEDSASQTMRAAGWNADAIDPNWPEDLRDKMLERSEKELAQANNEIQRREKAERKVRGLEYLKLSPDELDRKILAGEWIGMLDDIGPDSPEGKALIKLANKDNPASQSAISGRGGRTMLQYASSEYERLVGNPGSAKRRPDYIQFIRRVEEERDALAEELNVDPQLIPNGKQKEIIDKHLMNGDWRWFDDFPLNFSGNRRRYQVDDEDLAGWKPFEAAADLPAFAGEYFGPRDRRRELLPDGSVLIEDQDGKVVVINPDGSFDDPEGAE